MNQMERDEAIALLVNARKDGTQIAGLNMLPASVAEGHAIQDAVAARIGAAIGAFKANAPPGELPVRGLIFADVIFASPANVPVSLVPDLAVEGEIAFRFTRDLPTRAQEYSREEVADAVTAMAAVEIVSGRLQRFATHPMAEQLADCLNNGGLVTGTEMPDWHALDLAKLTVTAEVNSACVWDAVGGAPLNDPLAVAVALANMRRVETGVKAGQIVTTGSCTSLRYLKPGDTFRVSFAGLGSAEVTFTQA